MEKEIEKYNPLWLEAGCFGTNWFKHQQEYLQKTIDLCEQKYCKVFLDSEEQMEAWAPVLIKYDYTYEANIYYHKGILTIQVK